MNKCIEVASKDAEKEQTTFRPRRFYTSPIYLVVFFVVVFAVVVFFVVMVMDACYCDAEFDVANNTTRSGPALCAWVHYQPLPPMLFGVRRAAHFSEAHSATNGGKRHASLFDCGRCGQI